MSPPKFSFEASPEQLQANIDYYVDAFIRDLQSFFLVMPKGRGFVDFSRFQQAYRFLKEKTLGFAEFTDNRLTVAVREDPLVFVVLRAILGFSPPEFAYIAKIRTGVEIDQSSSRRLDKRAREGQPLLIRASPKTKEQMAALITTAVALIKQGVPSLAEGVIHRLDKLDTKDGLTGVQTLAQVGVPYEVLLYERFLGRPFATHRDSVSGEVGDIMEEAVKGALESHKISYHKAGVAERFEDLDQAPDFLVPNQFQPVALLEAKLAEDDGTARDKVTRVQHLAEIRDSRLRTGLPSFEVIACVDGRGFGIRREDVKKLLVATKGKLFTLRTVNRIVEGTSLRNLRK